MRRYICEIDALLNDIRFFSFPIVKFLPTGWMDGYRRIHLFLLFSKLIRCLVGGQDICLDNGTSTDIISREIIGIIFIPLCNCELIRWN